MLKLSQADIEIYEINPLAGTPDVIYLHDGLGAAASWRELPRRLGRVAPHRAILYSRAGHGEGARRASPRSASFLHDAAARELSDVIRATGARAPILIGHSDGASIALLRAAVARDVRGVVAIAPHLFVEPRTLAAIRRLRRAWIDCGVPRRLRRLHGAGADALLDDWTRAWLAPEFAAWNIEAAVARARCPVLLVQGDDDAFGTRDQVDRACTALGDRARLVIVPGADHSPHHTHPTFVLPAIETFLRSLATISPLAQE